MKCSDEKSNSFPEKSIIPSRSPDQSEAVVSILCASYFLAQYTPLTSWGQGIPSWKTWLLLWSCTSVELSQVFSSHLVPLCMAGNSSQLQNYSSHCSWRSTLPPFAFGCGPCTLFLIAGGSSAQSRSIVKDLSTGLTVLARENSPTKWQWTLICCNFWMERHTVSNPLLNCSLESEKCI